MIDLKVLRKHIYKCRTKPNKEPVFIIKYCEHSTGHRLFHGYFNHQQIDSFLNSSTDYAMKSLDFHIIDGPIRKIKIKYIEDYWFSKTIHSSKL